MSYYDTLSKKEKFRQRAKLFSTLASITLIVGLVIAGVLLFFVPLGFIVALVPLIPASIVTAAFTIIATIYDVRSRTEGAGNVMTSREKISSVVKISLLGVLVAIIIYTFLYLA